MTVPLSPAAENDEPVLPAAQNGDLDHPRSDKTESRLKRSLTTVSVSVLPVIAAIIVGGLLLLVLGRNPFLFYSNVISHGLIGSLGRQESLIRMGPLLLLAAGLMVAFPAGIWNLGGDGQFVLAGVVVAALGPQMAPYTNGWILFPVLFVVAFAVGAAWSIVPGIMKAWLGMNEIITTLMATFLGLRLSALLVKEFFADPSTTVPQTKVLPVKDRLPRMFGTRVNIGLVIGIVAILGVHYMMTRTAFGLRLRIVGMNPAAAIHAGMNMKALTMSIFLISSGLAGMAAAVQIVGVDGVVRAEWNPAFGFTIVPLVFLARFNGPAVIGFVGAFAVLQIGGEWASRQADLPNYFVIVLVALMLLFLAVSEYLQSRSVRAGER